MKFSVLSAALSVAAVFARPNANQGRLPIVTPQPPSRRLFWPNQATVATTANPKEMPWQVIRPLAVVPVAQSGFVKGGNYAVLAQETVHVQNAAWLRLDFAEKVTALSNQAVLKITSLLDEETQFLNGDSLNEWSYTSAYFNGDSVLVQVLQKMGDTESSMILVDNQKKSLFQIDTVEAGEWVSKVPMIETICNAKGNYKTSSFSSSQSIDQRELSYARRSARMMPVGCTGWLINDQKGCFLTAGHCHTSGGMERAVFEFQVPLSHGRKMKRRYWVTIFSRRNCPPS